MNLKKSLYIFSFITSLAILFSVSLYAIDPMAQLSPQEIEQLQQQQIEAIQTMTPAQRDQFEQDMLQAMSPEERTKYELFKTDLAQKTPEQQFEFLLKSPAEQESYINQLYETSKSAPEAFMPPALPQGPLAPTAPTGEVKVPEEPKKVIEPKKRDQALNAIDGIIRATADFLQRVDSTPEFAGKFVKWVQQGKIHNIAPSDTWDIIRKKIDSFVDDLKKVQEPDRQTKEYKFLNDFVEDEGLLSNVTQLNTTLQAQKARFEETDKNEEENEELAAERAFGLMAASKDTRDVMRTVINAFLEAFDKTKIPENIAKVKEKYEPVAKKAKETEEEKKKRAIEESKRERRTEYTVVGGTSDEGYNFGGGMPNYSGMDYSGGYSPLGGLPDYGAPPKPVETEQKKPEPSKTDSGAQKDSDKDKKKDDDKVLSDVVKQFESNMVAAVEDNINSTTLEKVGKHMTNSAAVDTDAASNKLPNAVKKLKAAAGKLRTFKTLLDKKGLGSNNQYSDQIKAVYEEFKKPLDNVYQQVSQAKAARNAASQEKQEAFFGGTTTLSDLQNAVQELRSAYAGSNYTEPATSDTVVTKAPKAPAATAPEEKVEKKAAEEAVETNNSAINRIIDQFEKNLTDVIEETSIDGKQLSDIKAYLRDEAAPQAQDAIEIRGAITTIKQAANRLPKIRQVFEKKKMKSNQREAYGKVLKDVYDSLFQDQLRKIQNDIGWFKLNEEAVGNDAKREAFFAVPEREDDAAEAPRALIYELEHAIQTLNKQVQDF